MTKNVKQKFKYILPFLLLFTTSMVTYAETSEERVAYHKTLPVQTNLVENWPTGPVVGAQSAILIEANTGVILYAKKFHMKE